ncbi:ATP-dependent DNA helicase RecQ [Mytilus galloprovincialis]|uniref:ATP-dependent DNA helicase RecQ n=1 Tax=Mytilus galloprovincialis TaxID=29158 RepID=A0A8B6FZ07_MYTGA|nr:ATP-dependent DNA helicase RecQ [Mytilus galloprovincialis]
MDAIRAKEKFDSLKSEYNMKFEVKDEQIEVALTVINGRNVLGLLPTGYGIKEGKFSFLFSSPESALMPQWRSVFMSDVWQNKLKLIAIDEAHCVSEWGGESFRKEYQRLFELRSFFDVPVMALTATSTKEVKADIFKYLQLSDECTDIVFKSPDRANIYIQFYKRVTSDYDESLKWLIDHLRLRGIASKKIIVYCRSIDRVSEIFCTLKDCLGVKAYIDGIKDPNNILIEMFHKSTHQDSKDRILKEFKLKISRIRCVIATVALNLVWVSTYGT